MGNPSLPLPIIITLAFGDSESFVVASIPFSCKIFEVKEALNILLAVAFPSASILCLSASCFAFSNLNSYSNASCSCLNFLSIASFMATGRVTSNQNCVNLNMLLINILYSFLSNFNLNCITFC